MNDGRRAKLILEGGFDEREAFEAKARGYRSGAVVELSNGFRYRVVFWDPVRLGQDLEAESSSGNPYLAEPGMIVIPEVTEANMQEAVNRLLADGFFEHLQPIKT